MTLQVALENVEHPLQLHRSIAALNIEDIDDKELRKTELSKEIRVFKRNLLFVEQNMDGQTELINTLSDTISELEQQYLSIPEYRRLASLRKTDETKVTDEVILLICWLQSQLNVSQNMNEIQIEMLAIDIVQTYSALRLEDISACFKFGLKGVYGKIYERIDAAVLHGWLVAYSINRHDSAAERNLNLHYGTKENRNYDPMTKPRNATADPVVVAEAMKLLRKQPLNNV